MVKRYNLKTRKGLITLFLLVLLISFQAAAQNEVAIGSASTKSNAILWLNGNGSQGLILPVVTNKTAVASPDKGMIVYDNSDNKVWYRGDNAWVEVGGGGGSTANLNLAISGNQLQLLDGTRVQSTVNIAGGTPVNGSFMIWNGSSWQSATLGDVSGTNGQVIGIRGKALPALPTTTQALVYDGTTWKFEPLSGGTDSQTLTFTSPNLSISNGNSVNLSALDKDAQTLTLTGNNLSISGGNSVALPAATGVTSVTAGTGLTGGTITTTGTIGVDVGTTAGKIVQLDGTGKLPAVDGSQLLNLPVPVETGDISEVVAGTGLSGGGTTGSVTLNLDNSGVTQGVYGSATAIPQMTVDAQGRITAVTTFPPLVADGSITGGAAGAGVKIAANTITDANIASLDAGKITSGVLPAAQVPNLDASKITSGTIGTQQGGTGISFSAGSIANGDLLIGNQSNQRLEKKTLDPGNGINITNGAGTISISTSGNFGSQNLTTSGTLNAGATTVTGLTIGTSVWPANASGILTNNGTGTLSWAPVSSGTVTNVTGTAPISVATGTTTPVISISQANSTNNGYLSSADWNTFNNKGTVSSIGAGTGLTGGPITTTGTLSLANTAVTPATYGTTIAIPQITIDQQGRITAANNQTIPTASTTTTGLLSTADWNTFNSKGTGTVTSVTGTAPISVATGTTTPVISLANTAVTPGTYGTTLTIPQIAVDAQGRITSANSLAIPTANTTTTGLLSTTDWNTFNNKGTGSVTSVGLAMPSIFTVTGSPITTTGTLTAALASQAAANVFAAPSGAPGAPSFRALVSTDIPNLDAAKITSGALSITNGGTGGTNATDARTNLGLGTLSTLNTISSTVIADGTIANIDISGTAAIDGTKITPAFGDQNISTTGTLTAGTVNGVVLSGSSTPTLSVSGTTLVSGTNTGDQTITLTGDVTGSGNGSFATTIGASAGGNIITAINASATSIDGARVNPNFGAQPISTTGTLTTGNSTTFGTATTIWPAANAAGTLTNDGTGTLIWSPSTASSWGLTGNAGTNPATNFIGTTDAQPLRFNTGVGGVERMRITSTGNVGIGTTTPTEVLDINGNININTGSTYKYGGNTIISLPAGTGGDNMVIGKNPPPGIAGGQGFNVIVGQNALNAATPTARANVAIGYNSQQLTQTAIDQVSVGTNTLVSNTTGSYNTAVGTGSLRTISTTSYNSALGWHAGINVPNGNYLTLVGETTDAADGLTNATAIGSKAYVTQSNSIVLGSINGTNGATSNTNVGIGTTAPAARLDVVGTIKITDGTQALNRVLTSDANGLASWQPVGGTALWGTSGNTGLTSANWIGPQAGVPFNIRIGTQRAGWIDPTTFNTTFGQGSGENMAAGGVNNTAFGYRALIANTTGDENTVIGYNAMQANTVSNANTAVGKSALFSLAGTGFGGNTGIGYHSLYESTTGYYNVSMGYFAGSNSDGTGTTVGITTGNRNTFIGANSGALSATISNAAAIGAWSAVSTSNSMVLGSINGVNGATQNTSVGIGTTSPNSAYPLTIQQRPAAAGLIAFNDNAGVLQGQISIAGGVLTYGTFTGSHLASLADNIVPQMGSLITMTGEMVRTNGEEGEPIYKVKESSIANDPKILGTYFGNEPGRDQSQLIMAAGNGEVWVIDNGSDLEVGDYLISSEIKGHAMKEDGTFEVAHVFAKVAERVKWREVTENFQGRKHKRISVLFETFTKNNKAESLSADLEKTKNEVEMLRKEMEIIKSILGIEAKNKIQKKD